MSGLGAIVASLILSKPAFLTVTTFFIISFLLFHKKNSLKSVHMSDSIGEVLYPIALFILALFLFDNKVLFIQGILILALSDTSSAFIGKKYSQRYNTKSGFLAHLITSFIIMSFSTSISNAFIISLVLAIVESTTFRGWDNITVPTVYLLLVRLLQL
jgi:dolichol kinase